MKNQVQSTNEYPDLEEKLDSMGLLNLIKKLVHTGGMNNLNTRHNMAMSFVNLMKLYKDRFQTIQDFRDQYMAMKKVCNMLELCWQM